MEKEEKERGLLISETNIQSIKKTYDSKKIDLLKKNCRYYKEKEMFN